MSDNQANLTRRTILSAAGAGAAMAFLAACGSSSDNANTTPSAAATTPANDPTTAAPSPTATASATATKTSAPAAPAADAVIALDKVPVGGSVAATVDGQPVIVSQPTKGKVACFSAICTHQGATVNPDGKELICPRHGSAFDSFTGAVVNGPASSPLPAVSVKVDGGNVVAG